MNCFKCNQLLNFSDQFCSACGEKTPEQNLLQPNSCSAGSENLDKSLKPHPWMRYFARWVDYPLFGLTLLLISILFINFAPSLFPAFNLIFLKHEALTTLIIVLAWVFIEPLFLSLFATTPGKWIFNLKVLNNEGSKLSYSQALSRSFSVYVRGVGLGFPLISFITMIRGYSKLTSSGTTTWDKENSSIVKHAKIKIIHIAAMLFVFSLCAYLIYLNIFTGQKH